MERDASLTYPPERQPGENMKIAGMFVFLAAVCLLLWAFFFPTAVPVSESDRVLSSIDPERYPLPSTVNNLGLMQTKLVLYIGAGFTALIGTTLYGFGAVVAALGRTSSASTSQIQESGPR
jgi:hypothetical protein